jgi:hypothetical protein
VWYDLYMITLLLTIGCTIPFFYDPHSVDADDIQAVGKVGDILIQTEFSPQSGAIRDATDSLFSHAGVLIDHDDDGTLEVIEAVGPVKITSVDDFLDRGSTQIRRLRDYDLHKKNIDENLEDELLSYLGMPYDLTFKWDSDEIYCTELVWKAYARIGIEVSPLSQYSGLDLTGDRVQALIALRLEKGEVINSHELIVTPADFEHSPDLIMIEGD